MLSEKTVRKNAAIEISAVFKMEADLTKKEDAEDRAEARTQR
jgi:hypothetical protein